jgi:hypothetical protein
LQDKDRQSDAGQGVDGEVAGLQDDVGVPGPETSLPVQGILLDLKRKEMTVNYNCKLQLLINKSKHHCKFQLTAVN